MSIEPSEITFNTFFSESSFLKPDNLSLSSAWIEHVPFAFWLVEQLNPELLVELGVHTGVSYFSFCQSVKHNHLSTRCYGIDTWEGDEHAGKLTNEVWQEVNQYNHTFYSSFSYLLKSNFNDALQYFEDATIDLLHIDGFHTYEAVKEDFEKWLPKMSRNGIILFHDIMVREREFGVYLLWLELKQMYNTFEFYHGFGLGVLSLGEVISNNLKALFCIKDEKVINKVRFVYAGLGAGLKRELEKDELINNSNVLSSENIKLKEELSSLMEQVNLLKTEVNKHLEEKRILQDNVRTIQNESNKKEEELKREYTQQLNYLHQQLKEKEQFNLETNFQLKEENKNLTSFLVWYTQTYESRSLLGVVKEKLHRNFKKSYISAINALLKKDAIQKKYGVSYALEFTRDNGLKSALTSITKAFESDGLDVFTRSRKILHQKAAEKFKEQQHAVPLPDVVTEEINYDALVKDLEALSYKPKISLVFPTYNTKTSLLKLAIGSIQHQVYSNWEICIVDDGSTNKETKELLQTYTKCNNIKVQLSTENKGISEASNRAIEISTGDFIALMDHDDEITPDALYWIVKELNNFPDTDIIYTDECKVDESGKLSDIFYKPDWSPELLFNSMYTGHLTVYNKAFLLNKVGLFRKEYNFSQDYDLMLRAVEQTDNIRHIQKVLYHWRITEGSSSQGDKPFARISNLAALEAAAKRRKIAAAVIELPTANRLQLQTKGFKKVSIIIPTDSYNNLKEGIESIIVNTSYTDYEIVAVTNSLLINEMRDVFSYPNISFVAYDKPYNFSDKCNSGAKQATGDILVFFNDDVRPMQANWIENLVEYLSLEGIGGVSPKLVYEDDTIQYAGMATGVRNLVGTTFHGYNKDALSYFNFPQLLRNVSILSGACMAVLKDLFLKLGGFDAVNTPSAHSDVDFSFKILEAGYRCLYTPYSSLRHIGHLSLKEYEKGGANKKDKADIYLLKKWIKYVSNDPFFPEPMKGYLYHDSPEYYKLHAPKIEVKIGNKGDVLLVSHDLSLTGAPMILYNTAKLLLKNEYFVVVCCSSDGPLRQMFLDAGIPVIIDELIERQHPSFKKFAKNFDLIIANTVVVWPVVSQMQKLAKTIWWIHEGKVLESFSGNDEFVQTLKEAQQVIGISDYALSYIKKYNKNVVKIFNACSDVSKGLSINKQNTHNDKIICSIIGSVERRKGHDVLIKALEKVDKETLNKTEILIIGRIHDAHFYCSLKEKINSIGCIKLIEQQSHADCLRLMKESDIIINASRDEPFSVALVEAFCLGKTCIVSSNCGIKELIINGENGFVFNNDDEDDLAKQLTYIVSNKKLLNDIGDNARKTYEKYLTAEVFEDKLIAYLKGV